MRTLKKGDPKKTVAAKKARTENELKENLDVINSIDQRLAKTFFAIEADSYASHMLWKENKEKYKFVQDQRGLMYTIGHFNKKPIVLECFWYYVNSHPVMFYNCCSQVVHHGMVDEWFSKYMPHIKHKDNAENAHNVLGYCVEEKAEPPKRIIKCYTCMDSKQVEVRRIGYDSIMGTCPNCK